MNKENVHAPKFRETKESQARPAAPVSDLFRLDDRTIVVTGGSGALGVAVAQAILESGGDVVCLDVVEAPKSADWEPVQAAAKKHSRNLFYHQCNVSDEQGTAEVFAKFTPELKAPLRGLVCCAAVAANGPSVEFPVDSFRRVLDVNLTGTFVAAQAVAKELRESQLSGSMVFVASISGYGANKGVDSTCYNTSKAAVHQLARSLAAEWGSRVGMPLVRVNTLSPGYIRTTATAGALQLPGVESMWLDDSMLYRLSTVDEFRAPVLFLLGDGSSFMTGADLRVDGGHCAW